MYMGDKNYEQRGTPKKLENFWKGTSSERNN